MEQYKLIQGEYAWGMSKKKVFGKKRVVMAILKDEIFVGFIAWHPGSKSLVFNATYSSSKELIDFVRPYMDKQKFYFCWKLDKLLKQNASFTGSHVIQ